MERYNVYQLTLDYERKEGIKLGQLQSPLAISQAMKQVDEAKEQANQAKEQVEQERNEKLKALSQMHNAIKALRAKGMANEEIAEIHGMTVEEVRDIV